MPCSMVARTGTCRNCGSSQKPYTARNGRERTDTSAVPSKARRLSTRRPTVKHPHSAPAPMKASSPHHAASPAVTAGRIKAAIPAKAIASPNRRILLTGSFRMVMEMTAPTISAIAGTMPAPWVTGAPATPVITVMPKGAPPTSVNAIARPIPGLASNRRNDHSR